MKGKPAVRNVVVCCAGFACACGWLLLIDGNALQAYRDWSPDVAWYCYIPPVIATLSLVMVNLLDLSYVNPDMWEDSRRIAVARLWLGFWFFMHVAAIVSAISISAVVLFDCVDSSFAGTAVLLSPLLIFVGSMLFICARMIKVEEEFLA
ncbi:hypothetical protein Pelo_13571 [Pelomyxa schiedti]|nr:hypothetical protein Pelo_13571 [Pelomyxa schiedti]